ncbi:unnamed protein product [Phytomonas sp. EM1]|nr:unnamed protein product [Phytomonas sp. EM1]|eukprot:CCW60212.1 unnamed protein product [Phytomonas sp. isolate EM1]
MYRVPITRVFAARGVCSHGVRCFTTIPALTYPAELPKLAFDYKEGIKPVISPRQMELHYTKHHKAYVDKLNSLGKGEEGKTIEAIIHSTNGKVDKKVMFNQAAQHFNHSFYWNCLFPGGKPMPKRLEEVLCKQFGNIEKFKQEMQTSAVNNFGSGWTWLCVDPSSKELVILNTSNAECPITKGPRPIFTIDVWEHAYYKDFENRRPDYVNELWGIVNWEYVDQAYERAMSQAE